jgi:hypothetical protein
MENMGQYQQIVFRYATELVTKVIAVRLNIIKGNLG